MARTVVTPQQRIHFSTPLRVVKPPGRNNSRVEFGKKWKELVQPVSAIRIKFSEGMISSIKNIVEGDVEYLEHMGHLTNDERTHIFELVSGERIHRVDVDASERSMNAIRFHTNFQVSQWFGKATTPGLQITAPDGCYIHSLCGAISQGDACGNHGLRELGALYYPIANNTIPPMVSETEVKLDPLVDFPTEDDDYRVNFAVSTDSLAAIVVSVDSALKWIRVVSASQLDKLMKLQNGIQPEDTERWVNLMCHETITGVTVVYDDNVIVGIRFKTTSRTTAWIGKAWRVGSLFTCVSHEVTDGDLVRGFHGARGREGMTSLGLIVGRLDRQSADEVMLSCTADLSESGTSSSRSSSDDSFVSSVESRPPSAGDSQWSYVDSQNSSSESSDSDESEDSGDNSSDDSSEEDEEEKE